jgi:hypothetical protein
MQAARASAINSEKRSMQTDLVQSFLGKRLVSGDRAWCEAGCPNCQLC